MVRAYMAWYGHGGKIPDFSGTGIVHVLQYCSDNDCDSDDEPSTMYTKFHCMPGLGLHCYATMRLLCPTIAEYYARSDVV